VRTFLVHGARHDCMRLPWSQPRRVAPLRIRCRAVLVALRLGRLAPVLRYGLLMLRGGCVSGPESCQS
jgi:hypothetical protein